MTIEHADGAKLIERVEVEFNPPSPYARGFLATRTWIEENDPPVHDVFFRIRGTDDEEIAWVDVDAWEEASRG